LLGTSVPSFAGGNHSRVVPTKRQWMRRERASHPADTCLLARPTVLAGHLFCSGLDAIKLPESCRAAAIAWQDRGGSSERLSLFDTF